MFKKKPTITHVPDDAHLIEKVPGSAFKKGQILEIPAGHEALMFAADGTQQILKNVNAQKLETDVQYVYLAKSNRKIIRANWGTPTRIQLETHQGPQTIGAFGYVEFQLVNPIRYITTRMESTEFADEALLSKLVLSRIPDALHRTIPELEPLDISQESKMTLKLKETLSPVMEQELSGMGIQIQSFIVENVNFQPVKEDA